MLLIEYLLHLYDQILQYAIGSYANEARAQLTVKHNPTTASSAIRQKNTRQSNDYRVSHINIFGYYSCGVSCSVAGT